MGSTIDQVPHRVALVIVQDFSNLGLALAIEPMFIANWLTQRRLFEWQVLSVDGRPVAASNGMRVAVDASISEVSDVRTAIVLASFNVKRRAQDQRLIGWLRRVARFGIELGAIETASEILAAAGLLDHHPASVHWDNFDGFRERHPRVEAVTRLFTLGEDRMTCAGATAILDMMLAWIGKHRDRGLADEVARHLLLDRQRPSFQEQGAPETGSEAFPNQSVRKALKIMRETIEEPLSCREIARRLGLSQRQLQRHFQRQFGTTLIRQYLLVRLAHAHKLLQQTDLSVTEVAIGSGFASLPNFSRNYAEVFGRPPSRDRQQSVTAPVFRHRRRR